MANVVKGMRNAVVVMAFSFLGAFLISIFGDMVLYDPANLGDNETGVGISTESTGATVINNGPIVVVALGFLIAVLAGVKSV